MPFFSHKLGGSVTVPYELSKELAKRNHEVTIITTDWGFDQQYADTIRDEGVNVIPFTCVANFGLFLYSPSMKIWLEKNLNEFDIIHLHNYRSYQNGVVRSFAVKLGIPYIIQAHGSVLPFFEKQTLKKMYDFVWGNKILLHASKLIAVSKVEKEQYVKMGVPEDKIEIIPNGFDLSKYEILPKRGTFRKKFGIEPNEKMVIYLGRLHKRKGIDFLIKGFAENRLQHPNTKLIIAGPDNGFLCYLKSQVTELKLSNSVMFTGFLSETEKIEALVDADLFVNPGTLEIFGLVPFEAIMCGTPVIVADDCGCGEIIREADCGYLVTFGDTAGLNTKINEALRNIPLAEEKVLQGQQYIKGCLTWNTSILKFEKLYEDCLHV
jgi:glycosyltransferase involved in cell wall biosynthesis